MALLTGCSVRGESAAPSPTPTRIDSTEVEALFDAALPALVARDRKAWREALPVRGKAARATVTELYTHLSPLTGTSFDARAKLISSDPDFFEVSLIGEIGGVGPADRLLAERVFQVRRIDDRLVLVADKTPDEKQRVGVLTFESPRLIRGKGVVVLYESLWWRNARGLADDSIWARRQLRRLGITTKKPVFIALYSSHEQIADAFGRVFSEDRMPAMSISALRLSALPWTPTDIAAFAPAITGTGDWVKHMLAHEMTHAFTMQWFAQTEHEPPLLLEGIAEAVEGSANYYELRAAVARDPAEYRDTRLLADFAVEDVWKDRTMKQVRLSYLEAGAVMGYILKRWGPEKTKQFSLEVADSDLEPATIREIVQRTLGVSWPEFFDGWQAYLDTLP